MGSQTIHLWRFGLLIFGWGLGFWGWGFRILGLGQVFGTIVTDSPRAIRARVGRVNLVLVGCRSIFSSPTKPTTRMDWEKYIHSLERVDGDQAYMILVHTQLLLAFKPQIYNLVTNQWLLSRSPAQITINLVWILTVSTSHQGFFWLSPSQVVLKMMIVSAIPWYWLLHTQTDQ